MKVIACLTGVYGVVPGHDGTPAGRANRHGVVAVQNHAVVSEGVDVRGRNLVRTVETDVVPALKDGNATVLLTMSGNKRTMNIPGHRLV